jgi:hypothetical protein
MERWPSGRRRRSRKPLNLIRGSVGSNPTLSAAEARLCAGLPFPGGMAEWTKATVLKTVEVIPPWVRIPLPPLYLCRSVAPPHRPPGRAGDAIGARENHPLVGGESVAVWWRRSSASECRSPRRPSNRRFSALRSGCSPVRFATVPREATHKRHCRHPGRAWPHHRMRRSTYRTTPGPLTTFRNPSSSPHLPDSAAKE